MRTQPLPRGAAIRSVLFWLFALFLYAPFVGMGVLAFQGPLGGLTFPFTGPSLYWFADLIKPSQLIDFRPAIGRSVLLAIGVAALTLIISTMAALAFRRRFVGSGLVFYLAIAALMLPSQLVSIGVSLLWRSLGLQPAWYGAAVGAQLTWTLPFGLLIMISVFGRLSPAFEQAAAGLGASAFQVLRRITLPIVTPGLMAVALFGFMLSCDEFPRTSMLTGASNTLPLELVAFMSVRATPTVYALALATTLVSVTAVVAIVIVARRMELRRRTPA
jgi:putative spermidine/putrescine transport system permease protein